MGNWHNAPKKSLNYGRGKDKIHLAVAIRKIKSLNIEFSKDQLLNLDLDHPTKLIVRMNNWVFSCKIDDDGMIHQGELDSLLRFYRKRLSNQAKP